jgi:hypothetical protein
MMTWEARVRAVKEHGFTERQAGFLVMVMLHAGVCLGRQYCAFARIAYGQKMQDFFRELVAAGYATARRFRHHNARLYHIHHKPLYEVIGEPDNRHRKPTTLARAVEKLMLLDAVLATRDPVEWLATEHDKIAYFTLTRQIPRPTLPALRFKSAGSETVRHFADKLPIGLASDGRGHLFLYLATRPMPMDFRLFLERHAELLRALPEWTLRLLVPRHLTSAMARYQEAFREQVTTPLRAPAIDELRWFFQARDRHVVVDQTRFERATHAFAGPRFRALYRIWLERGDTVIDATMSPTLADAVARRTGRLECHVLPHGYLHLCRLVGTA